MALPNLLEAPFTEEKGENVRTQIEYLAPEPRYQHERPYELRYDAEGAIPATNMINEWKPVVVRNFRPYEDLHNFEEYGFRASLIKCPLTVVEYSDRQKVEQSYYPALETILKEQFQDVAIIKFLEHRVRTMAFTSRV